MEYDNLHDHCIIDAKLWEDLRNSDTDTISRNCNVIFDTKDKFYRVPVLNTEFAVFPWDENRRPPLRHDLLPY